MDAKLYRTITPYKSPYPDPIIFRKGERIKIIKKFTDDPDWKDWLWCEGENNNAAWAPKQFIDNPNDAPCINRDYNARELSVEHDEMLTVHYTLNGFAMAENHNGDCGWVPLKNIEPV